MTFIDRVPMYPGRIKLIPVSGQDNTFDMVRADEPLIEGTPLNKALFDGIDAEMTALRQLVSDTVFSISQRIRLENIADGTEIGLYENGILVPFIVVQKTYGSSKRALVVRKNIYKIDTLLNTGELFYAACKIDKWLNSEYIKILDPATQSLLVETSFEVAVSGMEGATSNKIFLLSSYELTGDADIGHYEGNRLSYFDTNAKRISTFNGTPAAYYTRTVDSSKDKNGAEIITATGTLSKVTNAATEQAGIRPAFTLPYDYEVTVGLPSTSNVMATAEEV